MRLENSFVDFRFECVLSHFTTVVFIQQNKYFNLFTSLCWVWFWFWSKCVFQTLWRLLFWL